MRQLPSPGADAAGVRPADAATGPFPRKPWPARIRDYLTRTKMQGAVTAHAETLRDAAEVEIGAES